MTKPKPNELKEVLSDAFTEYQRAYRVDETPETMTFPRDKYPDIASYQAAKVIEAFEITPSSQEVKE